MWLLFPDCPTLSRELDHKERIWDMNQQPYGLMAPWRGDPFTEPQLWNFKQCFNRLEMNFRCSPASLQKMVPRVGSSLSTCLLNPTPTQDCRDWLQRNRSTATSGPGLCWTAL